MRAFRAFSKAVETFCAWPVLRSRAGSFLTFQPMRFAMGRLSQSSSAALGVRPMCQNKDQRYCRYEVRAPTCSPYVIGIQSDSLIKARSPRLPGLRRLPLFDVWLKRSVVGLARTRQVIDTQRSCPRCGLLRSILVWVGKISDECGGMSPSDGSLAQHCGHLRYCAAVA